MIDINEQDEVRPVLLTAAGDEPARRFLSGHFGPISSALWRWFFHENPHGDSLIEAGFIGNEMVGINSVVMRRISIRGREHLAGQDSYLVTHPGFRRRGIMRKVVAGNWDEADRAGVDVIFIFQAADNPSLPGFVRCGAENLGRIGQRIRVLDATYLVRRKVRNQALARALALPLNAALRILEPPRPERLGLLIREEERFDERFTALWREVSVSLPLACVRDADWLNYRYCEHPERSYRIITASVADQLRGYAVIEHRPAENDQPAKTMLVDFLAARESRIAEGLIAETLSRARRAGSSAVYSWISRAAPWHSTFARSGFLLQSGVHGVLVQRIRPGQTSLKEIRLEDWCLAMGDSDLF